MTYKQQLRSPLWQKKRFEVLTRDKWKCVSCNSTTKNLQVHHLIYFEGMMPWEYHIDLLTTLCMDCHEKEKERYVLEQTLSVSLRINGFLYSDLLCLGTMLHDKKFANSLLKKLRKIQNGKKIHSDRDMG